jgi:hypothetical protein
MRKNGEKIECFVKNTDSGPSDRQTLKSGEYLEVEDALYTWFLQERNRHTPIYCILASCYIRFTLNICSFVHQCNTFTFY